MARRRLAASVAILAAGLFDCEVKTLAVGVEEDEGGESVRTQDELVRARSQAPLTGQSNALKQASARHNRRIMRKESLREKRAPVKASVLQTDGLYERGTLAAKGKSHHSENINWSHVHFDEQSRYRQPGGASQTWTAWPGLNLTVTFDEPVYVIAVYTTSARAGGAYIVSKLFVDLNEKPQTRSICGKVQHATTFGVLSEPMSSGTHNFEVRFHAVAPLVYEEKSDTQNFVLRVLVFPKYLSSQAKLVDDAVDEKVLANWTEWTGLRAGIDTQKEAFHVANYQVSSPAGGHISSIMHVGPQGNEQPDCHTASTSGNSEFSTLFGMSMGTRPAGRTEYTAMYKNNAEHSISFVEGGAGWQTRALNVVALEGMTELEEASQVESPTTCPRTAFGEQGQLGSTSSWTPWPGLKKSIRVDVETLAFVMYQTATLTNIVHGASGGTIASVLYIDHKPQAQTRSAVGFVQFATTVGTWVGLLEPGTHEFEVFFKLSGESQKLGFLPIDNTTDWETRFLRVVALPVDAVAFTAHALDPGSVGIEYIRLSDYDGGPSEEVAKASVKGEASDRGAGRILFAAILVVVTTF